jgi:HPt (histidine-containing phosphotransfer) domain-containing protein
MEVMICDTSFLKEQCDNDQEMVESMIDMFIATAPGYLERMNTAFETQHYTDVKDAAHGFLSSLKIMGATAVVEVTKQLETEILEELYINVESLLNQVNTLTKQAIEELVEVQKK